MPTPSDRPFLRPISLALLVGVLLLAVAGSFAVPRPVAAALGCPNCATLHINLSGNGSGTVTDGLGNSCAYSEHVPAECTFSYQWLVSIPGIQVVLTATPLSNNRACDLQGGAGCGGLGESISHKYTLENGWSPSASFEFDPADIAWIKVEIGGTGAGTVVDADHPGWLTCSYSSNVESGDCIREYFWDPQFASITLSIEAKAAAGSVTCLSLPCDSPMAHFTFSLTLPDGATQPIGVDFEAIAASSPSPTPTGTPHATSRPVASVGATAPAATPPATTPVPPSGGDLTPPTEAATPASTGSPVASSPAAATPVASADGGVPVLLLAVVALAIAAGLLGAFRLGRSRPS
ncbi:MAG: hypothetical protein HY263_03540 [Chloroflexi bacterium]|nr:hypothetical protein [Chloroflexota bacterium]